MPLLAWRQKYGIAGGVAAAVLGISPELLIRIECGEVEPEPALAMRIHVVTGGDVPVSAWSSVYPMLLKSFTLSAIGAKGADGVWGVDLFLGSERIAHLDSVGAKQLEGDIAVARALIDNPPEPLPLFAMDNPYGEQHG